MRSLRLSWVFALVAFVAVASSAFASPPPTDQRPGTVSKPVVTQPGLTPAPVPTATSNSGPRYYVPNPIMAGPYVGAMPDGATVPLARLPRLPMKSPMNTATPKRMHMLHPMAASGASIDFSTTYSSCSGSGSLGDQFNVGCSLAWNSINAGSDTKQDYEIAPGTGNEFKTSATAVGGTYTSSTGTTHSTTLSTTGTYIFGVYDVTTSSWIAVVYVNAGQVFSIRVYQDSFHTQEQYQFSATSGTNAYIYLANVSQSDYLAVGVSQTAVSPNCVFMAPAPLPSPYSYPANQLCNMTLSTGIQAPGGNLSVTWPMSTSYSAGTYSVEVYDITAGVRLGQVQVSITNSTGIALNMYPDTSGADINSSPGPNSVATPSTVIAWDGSTTNGGAGTDESVTGVKTTVSGLTNGSNYLWSLIDPHGQVAATKSGTISGNAGSNIFTFDSLSGGISTWPILPPGDYPARSWVVQLYDTTHKTVDASQSFEILGYSTQTQFNVSGSLTDSLNVPTGATGTTVTLRLTNNSSSIWNGFGDYLQRMDFTTGPDYALTGTGSGIMTALNGQACGTSTCTETVTDSAGSSWTATNLCTASSGSGYCYILLTPVLTSTFLAPGAYIDVTNVTFYMRNGSTCRPCQGATSELPEHGMYWSSIDTASGGSIAWTPVYFNKTSGTTSATAIFRFVGSENLGTATVVSTPPTPNTGYVGTHFYTNTTNQSDYANTSPYTVTGNATLTSSYEDIWGFTFNNTSSSATTSEIAIALPGTLTNQGWYSVDSNTIGGVTTSNNWSVTSCPSGFSTQWLCLAGNFGHTIASGGTEHIYIDQSQPQQSYAFTELQVEGYMTQGSTSSWISATSVSGGNESTVDGRNASLDNLEVGAYSLLGNDMTGAFNPTTVGVGGTSTIGWTLTNVGTGVDANPDSIDAFVLEAPNTTVTLNNTPTVSSPSGWSYLGKFAPTGGHNQYWFGTCSAFFTNLAKNGAGSYGGPPNATGAPVTTPFVTPYPTATCNPDTSAAGPGTTVTATNMQFSNLGSAGTYTWYMYAHGANGGGWSTGVPFSLTVTAEAASVWFNQINGTAVATNTVPTISSGPNSYQYAIKNTSASSKLSTINITIPGLDINNQNAYDGTNTWSITNIDTAGTITLSNPSGQADGTAGCTVSTSASNTYNPTTGGANGQIQLTCTNFNPGDIVYVNFTAQNPSSQNDTYIFPTTVDGYNAGQQWLDSNEITEQFSLGLNIVVDPSNPGPGGSTPVVLCGGTCTFSGTTVDFGNIPNNTTYTFQDVVRTSIVYTGATSSGHTLDLYVEASQNPTNSTGSPTNELLTSVDSTNSTQGASISFLQTSYAVVPTTGGASGYGLHIAQVPETYRSTSYDILDNYEVAIGAESISGTVVTLTYTVVPN